MHVEILFPLGHFIHTVLQFSPKGTFKGFVKDAFSISDGILYQNSIILYQAYSQGDGV